MEQELLEQINKIENELNSLKMRNEIDDEILKYEKLKNQILQDENKKLTDELIEEYTINQYLKNENQKQ